MTRPVPPAQSGGPNPITPRNVHFAFDESLPENWHSGDPATTLFYDALSLTFPEGERFFMDSVRNFADAIHDPALQGDVTHFMAQEAVHSREHIGYNALLARRGVPVEKFNRAMHKAAEFAKRYMSYKSQLAATCAYEHFTALFAETALGDPRAMAGAHPFYRDLWYWHAIEEQEHKAVAFDVYQTIAPGFGGYLRRVSFMIIATLDFMIFIPVMVAWLMAHTGEFWNVRSWARCFWHLWGRPGVWRHVLAGVGAYLVPGFHPWQRELKPQAQAWRARYHAMATRTPEPGQSLFDVP